MRSPQVRHAVALLAAVAPQRLKHLAYRRLLGWEIHPTARFGLSFIDVGHLVAGRGVAVSHLNVIKGCDEVRLGDGALVGPLNWVTAAPLDSGLFPTAPDRRPRLVLGREASITTRHYIECDDEVRIDELAILGGLHSRVITHWPDLTTARQSTRPVVIGSRSMVTAHCTLLPGAVVPARSVVAASATVGRGLVDELRLYGGTPARAIKDLDPDMGLFQRTRGFMD